MVCSRLGAMLSPRLARIRQWGEGIFAPLGPSAYQMLWRDSWLGEGWLWEWLGECDQIAHLALPIGAWYAGDFRPLWHAVACCGIMLWRQRPSPREVDVALRRLDVPAQRAPLSYVTAILLVSAASRELACCLRAINHAQSAACVRKRNTFENVSNCAEKVSMIRISLLCPYASRR